MENRIIQVVKQIISAGEVGGGDLRELFEKLLTVAKIKTYGELGLKLNISTATLTRWKNSGKPLTKAAISKLRAFAETFPVTGRDKEDNKLYLNSGVCSSGIRPQITITVTIENAQPELMLGMLALIKE